MDGVLADCFEQFVRYEHADLGTSKTIADGIGKTDDETFANARTYLYQPGFFRNMPVIPGSQELLHKLNEAYELFIVSSATEFPQSLTEKQEWLNEHFPFIGWEQMVFCGKKTMISADIMIDDHFKNLDPFKGRTLLFTQPHNQLADAGKHTRVYSWNEIGHLLLSGQQRINTHSAGNNAIAFAPVISKYA